MTWILIIAIGGILGWVASKIMRTDAQQGVFLNIVVGVIRGSTRWIPPFALARHSVDQLRRQSARC